MQYKSLTEEQKQEFRMIFENITSTMSIMSSENNFTKTLVSQNDSNYDYDAESAKFKFLNTNSDKSKTSSKYSSK